MKPHVSLIVAMAKNRVIGINNTLPWHIPEDLKRFKALTMGHPMIMGRKTFDSIGKPLPGRATVVVTHNHDLKIAGCVMAHSLDEAITACTGDPEIFVIGGAKLFASALPLADVLYLTEIQHDITGDVFFPEFDQSAWLEIKREPRSQQIPQVLEYHFVEYERQD